MVAVKFRTGIIQLAQRYTGQAFRVNSHTAPLDRSYGEERPPTNSVCSQLFYEGFRPRAGFTPALYEAEHAAGNR